MEVCLRCEDDWVMSDEDKKKVMLEEREMPSYLYTIAPISTSIKQ